MAKIGYAPPSAARMRCETLRMKREAPLPSVCSVAAKKQRNRKERDRQEKAHLMARVAELEAALKERKPRYKVLANFWNALTMLLFAVVALTACMYELMSFTAIFNSPR